MYQRSADLFLGLPFNIASTALLTHIVAHQTGLTPAGITVCIGDGHIYANHTQQIQQQLQREPYEFPVLKVLPPRPPEDVSAYSIEDFLWSPTTVIQDLRPTWSRKPAQLTHINVRGPNQPWFFFYEVVIQ